METRTAPSSAYDKLKECQRNGWLCTCAAMVGHVCFLGFWASVFLERQLDRGYLLLAAVWFVGMFLDTKRLHDRAKSYSSAAAVMGAAISRYEVSEDRPESTLDEAVLNASGAQFGK